MHLQGHGDAALWSGHGPTLHQNSCFLTVGRSQVRVLEARREVGSVPNDGLVEDGQLGYVERSMLRVIQHCLYKQGMGGGVRLMRT